jgi:uncharacterized protein YggL (DUF469 family)
MPEWWAHASCCAVPCRLCSRERNRVHARKTRKRKKIQMESIQTTIETLQEEVSSRAMADKRAIVHTSVIEAGEVECVEGGRSSPFTGHEPHPRGP